MQCSACHKTIETNTSGFVVCPYCHTVNINTSSAGHPPVTVRGTTVSPVHIKKHGLFGISKWWATGALAVIVVAGVGQGVNLWLQHSRTVSQAQAQTKHTIVDPQKTVQPSKTAATQKPADTQPTAVPQPPAPSPKTNPAPVAQPKPVAPTPFTTPIQIIGDAACQADTLAALQLLSTKAPSHYATVTQYIGIITCASQGSGIYAYESPPRYVVGDATRNAGTVWYAGTIAHDAGHSKLYHDYLAAHPGQAVPDDVWTGKSAEITCLSAQYDALSKIGGPQSQLDYVQNVINTQYYNVPYSQRWW